MARPYQRALHDQRIDGFHWVQRRSAPYANQNDVSRFYFHQRRFIYPDKISKFICESNRISRGAVIRRLEQRFDHIFIDEIQDMAGYDIDVIELMLRSNIRVTLVGDHRQATLRTNNSAKNKEFLGSNIIKKFKQWEKLSLAVLRYETETFRCNQAVANLADSLFPEEHATISRNNSATGHDGAFAIPSSIVPEYIAQHRPQVLRFSKATNCSGYPAMNFGESKGLTFDRVLIFPHKKGSQWLASGDFAHVEDSRAKMYVGITRARYSVAFVYDGDVKVRGIRKFLP